MLEAYRLEGAGAARIAATVEEAVAAGELSPGQPLTPIRELAARIGVNPNTVAAAYRLLRERGVIETAGRRGSRVRARPASTAREALGTPVPPGVRDLSSGNPDPALLPALADVLADVARRHAERPVLYGAPPVSEVLRAQVTAALAADGVPPGPLAVTSGALDAIERILATRLRPGDRVAVEDPGWGGLLDLLPALGLLPEPFGTDDDGPVPDQLERALSAGVRAVVITCRAQNPTGAALTAERAGTLRALLRDADPLLVEDDHGHGITTLPLHPLGGATGRWAFVRSTAKAYGPDLRLAVVTGDEATLDRLSGRQRLGAGWVSHLLQDAVARLWQTGAVDPATVSAAYDLRRRRLLEELARRGVPARGRSGMNVWVPVPDETSAVARLLAAGWAAAPGSRFRIASPPGVRLTLSDVRPTELPALADAVRTTLAPPPAGRYG
ncbi:aminotransferase class I/II-fold pyridoxal phosphate-dependent enzyme [Streptomyces durbertensis]|uniref:Aminotransferase class I/II-fold pyridoxal phosphate-dependent enzyme n=1 Tax=Streptomyces durbertensis TaxID=2448886 RepID=A0ABR6EB37_9ACTN|nr:aminotransferase class I/II-fold pyridoxal phosphate-dependent enzyme [Streptomyces durbertensis]MBB1242540.1 aminotransferase class I/II-fold pyridoxal phosphate-dependent enzyme [Streptomyces durbertensis]